VHFSPEPNIANIWINNRPISYVGLKRYHLTMDWSNYKLDKTPVKPVLSDHPRGIVKWPLNWGWTPNTGGKKNSSLGISTEKTFDLKLGTFVSGVLIICENKQGKHSCVTVFEAILTSNSEYLYFFRSIFFLSQCCCKLLHFFGKRTRSSFFS